MLNAYSTVLAALLLAAGRLADRSGRRRLFFAGLFVFTAGSALCGAALTAAARDLPDPLGIGMLAMSMGALARAIPSEISVQAPAVTAM